MLIRKRENEFKPLLDSEQIVADVKEHLKPWVDLLRDITNYGTNLIPRCFSSSDRGLKDVVVIAILLRQTVAMLDGVEILLSKGASHAAHLQMRALFEASVYIGWILDGDSERKAQYYYVHNLRRKRVWASRIQVTSVEAREFNAILKESGAQLNDQDREAAARQIREIDRVLSQPKFLEINKQFDKSRKGKKYDPPWYAPLGEQSLGTMAK